MRVMIALSLLLNILVLLPVCAGLIADASWARASYGAATAARGILLSIYMAIGVVSALLLVFRDPKPVAALLSVQVVYKLTTPLTVGTIHDPVVVSNLGIATFHAVTLFLIWRAGCAGAREPASIREPGPMSGGSSSFRRCASPERRAL